MEALPILLLFVIDPHIKVFLDDAIPATIVQEVEIAAARGEHEPAQIVLRPAADLSEVTVEVSPLKHAESGDALGPGSVRWNFVGRVPIRHNTPRTPAERLVRKAPCDVPDVLLAERALAVKAGTCQPIWLTFRVDEEAAPGVYEGKITVRSGQESTSIPVRLTVLPFTLPRERHLLVTNWFSTSNIARAHGVADWSEAHWSLLEKYFLNMAEHRQNVALVPWRLIQATRANDGRILFDFSRFDRYVELMDRCGVADRIEIQHMAHFGPGGWAGPTIEWTALAVQDEASGKTVQLGFQDGLRPLLAALEAHLDERGWLDRSMIHVADEPSVQNLDSWKERAGELRAAAPRLRRIDAIEGSDFGESLEVWVPKLSHLNTWYPWLDRARRTRDDIELWFYICCHPFGGHYPNRFLDSPLIDVRILHWINASLALDGYLHWGLNHWRGDPFAAPSENLPPGDTHVIYPGPDGPLDSVRWEIQRESLEDFEALWLLTDRLDGVKRRLGEGARDIDPSQRARELARRLVPGLADIVRDLELLKATRREIAREILAAESDLPVLVNTRPLEGSEVVEGPAVIEVWGATLPGAEVKINNQPVPVRSDGRFLRSLSLSAARSHVRIEVEKGDATRAIEREFRVRE